MKIFLKIAISIVTPVPIVYFLLLQSNLPNDTPNGFIRSFYRDPVKDITIMDLKEKTNGIIGFKNDDLLIGLEGKDYLLKVAHVGNRYSREKFTAGYGYRKVFLMNNKFVLTNTSDSSIKLSLSNKLTNQFKLPRGFIYAIPLSLSSFITINWSSDMRFRFDKIILTASGNLTVLKDTIYMYQRGIYNDAQLLSVPNKPYIALVHYYHNKVALIDTALAQANYFRTLDTTSISSLTLLPDPKHPPVINQQASIYRDYLLICSNLKADNEKDAAYSKNIPIDVYDLSTKRYVSSFYVPSLNGYLVKSMAAHENGQLELLFHNNKLLRVRLNHEYFRIGT